MNTLREILEFVGLSGPQKFVPLPGNTGFTDPTMRTVGLQAPVLTNDQRSSMRAMIIGLQNLPPIGLEADGQALAGEVPFRPIVHVRSSNGVILETIGNIFQNGVLFFASSRNFGSSEASMAIVQLNDPGFYQFEVTRVGIPNTGITTLTETFDVIARAKPEPPPPPPPPLKEPTISVTTEGAGAGTVLVVSGSGFLPHRTVTVRVADEQLNPERNFQQSSTASGELRMRISLPCNSGLSFHVSATDSRPGPGILGVVFSNNVKLLCP
jgi:hypothetical protein